MEYEREFTKRLSPRIINPEYKELEQSTLKLFDVRLNLSHIRSECEDFPLIGVYCLGMEDWLNFGFPLGPFLACMDFPVVGP